MGMKLIVVCGLALFMTIPALFVGGLVDDRTRRAADVVQEISGHVGGQQTFLGPTLAIPYTIPPQSPDDTAKHGMYLVFPAQASGVGEDHNGRAASFTLQGAGIPGGFETGCDLRSDRSARCGPARRRTRLEPCRNRGWRERRPRSAGRCHVDADGKTVDARPRGHYSGPVDSEKNRTSAIKLTLFGAKADGIAKPNAQFNVTSTLRFSGAQRIAVLAYGKTTHLTAQGDWPSPGFDGGFLPVARQSQATASPRSGLCLSSPAACVPKEHGDSITGLDATALGVSFIEVADPYQSVNRSLKYVLLFLGLLFLSYFIFEVTTGKRVHPAQYVLVGIAQIIFYLLLLIAGRENRFRL